MRAHKHLKVLGLLLGSAEQRDFAPVETPSDQQVEVSEEDWVSPTPVKINNDGNSPPGGTNR